MLSQIENKYYKYVTRIADALERIANKLDETLYKKATLGDLMELIANGGEKDEQGH